LLKWHLTTITHSLNTIKKQMEKPVDNKPRKRIVIEETDSEEENKG
jgi:hypothetical protein